MIEIAEATTGEALEDVITIAGEYAAWFLGECRVRYPDMDLHEMETAHSYDQMRKKFPGENIPPRGGVFLARSDGAACGCVAVGPLDETACEMRTLFVRPEFRGLGVGKQLAAKTIEVGRAAGYRVMRLDTLQFMDDALGMYRRLGFYDIPPYLPLGESLRRHICFLECRLDA